MTQQIINVGAAVNDGTGESLRSAFQAVNNNFSNVWAHGPVDSQVVISNNVISTNVTNQTLVLRPDGTGVITVASSVVPSIDSVYDLGAANAQYDSVFARYYYGDASNMTGLPQPTNLETVNTDILPIATQAFDIGSQTQQWRKIYTGGIVAGNASVITIDVGNLHIPGGVNGYVLQTDGAGNLSWTAQTGGGGNGTPGGANTQIQFNSAGAFGGTADFTFNSASNVVTVPGDILPAGNSTQSLGNATRQWADLWVSNNTIYINSVPLTLSNNILSIDGNPIVTVDPGNVSNIGNFAFNENSLQNPNGANLNNGSLVNGWTAQLALPANGNTGAIALQNTYGNIVLGSGSNAVVTAQWTFANTGLLSSTGNIAANTITLSGQAVLANALGAVGELAFDFAGPAVNAYTGKSVNIRSNDQAHTWRFGTAGNLTLPDGSVIDQGGLYGNGSGVLGNATGDIQVYAQDSGVGIQTYDGTDYRTWFFDRNGNLTLPGNASSINYANGSPYGSGGANLGNLSIDNNNIYNTNGQGVVISNFSFIAEAETAYVQIPAGNSASDLSVVQKQGNVRLAANTADWTFDTTGNLTIPNGGYINFVNTGGITQAVNEDLRFTVSDNEEDGWAIQSTVNDGAGTDLTRMQVRYDGIRINTDVSGNNYSWDFRDSGDFDVPKSIRGPVGGNLVISIGDQPSSNTFIDLQTRSYVGDALISNVRIANPNVTVSTSSGAHTWTFDNTGTLNLPGGTGTVESSANNISIYSDAGQLNGMLMYDTGAEIYALQDFAIFTDNANASHIWRFYANGIMTAPGAINVGNLSIGALPGYITADANTGIILNVSGPDGGFVVDYLKEDGNANTSGGELAFSSELGNATYRISLSDDLGDGFATKIWRFDGTGNITLPSGGSVYSQGFTPSGNPGNTIVLNPHGSGSITNQKLMLYPTAGDGDHLHMTTGNLYQTELFLGSDDFYVKLANTGNVIINSNDSVGNIATWTFDNTGTLTVPGEGIIQSLNDTVVLQSKNTGSGNIVTARLGTNGGLYFEGTEYPNGWLSLTNNAGNANITAASGTSGGGGKNINITAGSADQSDYYNTSGGDVNIYSGIGAFNDGGGGGPGGNINIVAGDSADPAGHAGNVNISAGVNDWVFDYAGNLTLPSNSFTVNYANGTPVNLGGNYGDSNVATFLAAYGSNTVSTTGNVTAGNFIGSGSNVDIVAGSYDWTFANDGNLTLPGNTFAVNYANGSPVTTLPGTVEKASGTWTVTSGTNNYSFTVPANGVYQLWVRGNIPNGIITYTATVSITNSNVPVIGVQYAWNYEGAGNPILLTSIPNQIIGTAGAISNALPSVGTSTNTFVFGISNTSGGNVLVDYGYAKIS